jgi:hypothetical protein
MFPNNLFIFISAVMMPVPFAWKFCDDNLHGVMIQKTETQIFTSNKIVKFLTFEIYFIC